MSGHHARAGRRLTIVRGCAAALLILVVAAYLGLPSYSAWGTQQEELRAAFPGDEIISHPQFGYTMAVTIQAMPSEIWPWLLQMGQGRGGFYTHEWVENLLGADIHNADRIVPALQQLAIGDRIRLTPDPYLGHPGQFMTVAVLQPERALVFTQILPNGAEATWAFVLRSQDRITTRVLARRRSGRPTPFDRVMAPGYVFMDRGVLRGLRVRAERAARAEE
jgi:hypothetical protein